MSGPLGERVNDLAKDFNASQKDYKVVPTFKGTYDESMTAAVAAFRSGNAPHILQVYEVGTATMMAAKGAIKPVGEVMTEGGAKFDTKAYIPAVAGYYTAPNGQMLSFPFNSSTTIFYYNKDDFKAAGLDPEKAPTTWPEVALAAAKLKASGHKCPFTTSWVSWTQLESFSTWHNTLFATTCPQKPAPTTGPTPSGSRTGAPASWRLKTRWPPSGWARSTATACSSAMPSSAPTACPS